MDPAWVVHRAAELLARLGDTRRRCTDVITDALKGSLLEIPATPSFTRDIFPLLRQFNDAQWVNFGFAVQFGWQAPNDFTRPEILAKLAAAPVSSKDDPYGELRRQIFYSFRNPHSTTFEPLAWPPIYGDAFGSFDAPPVPRDGFSVTPTLYNYLSQWMQGTFIADYDPSAKRPASIDDVPLVDQPATLDLAALHFCMGGPFHPGCEMTWPMRHSSMYRSPYRLRQNPGGLTKSDYGDFLTQATINASDGPLSVSGPGDITKWMAVPWQADTARYAPRLSGHGVSIRPVHSDILASRVPNNVLTDAQYDTITNPGTSPEARTAAFNTRPFWLRSLHMNAPYIEQITKMVTHFGDLGLMLRRDIGVKGMPPIVYVETLAEGAKKLLAGAAPDAHGPAVGRRIRAGRIFSVTSASGSRFTRVT